MCLIQMWLHVHTVRSFTFSSLLDQLPGSHIKYSKKAVPLLPLIIAVSLKSIYWAPSSFILLVKLFSDMRLLPIYQSGCSCSKFFWGRCYWKLQSHGIRSSPQHSITYLQTSTLQFKPDSLRFVFDTAFDK